jgi:hypothetical protein
MKADNTPVDIAYTWVDDRFPGYNNMLKHYARTSHDTNPNRTRNNLDTLKYSLRSVEKYAPWIRNIYIVTSRPQSPEWFNHANKRLNLVHHDEIIQGHYLPTFNSFCIVSHLHKIQGLSERFLYIEDDILFGNHVSLEDFLSLTVNDLLVYPRISRTTPANKRDDSGQGPWNLALAYSNYLLNESYGEAGRRSVNRIPLLIEKTAWEEMILKWADAFTATRNSRFRSKHNIAPEYLYPYYMLYTGKARMTTLWQTYRKSFYLGIENNRLLIAAGLAILEYTRPAMYCLNDNFGDSPDARVVNMTKKFLEDYYPEKSSFET